MQHFVEQTVPQLLKTSWQGAVLILLVLSAQWLFGAQLKPRWRYALWLLVLVRLALPWTIPSPASVFNFVDFSHVAKPWKLHLQAHPATTPSPTPAQIQGQDPAASPEIVPGASTLDLTARCIVGVWLAGVLALAISLLISHLRLSRRISRERPLIDAPILHRLEECKQLMGVRVPVTVVETGEVGSPTLFGFIRPRLLLPAGFTRSFSPEELHHVFLHELAHIKRCDILVGWLMTAAQILHWFNPLVWVAGYRMRVDRELACDALALSYARDEENQRYGETIIKLLESFGRSAWSPGLAGAVENKNQLKERIRMIAKFKKTNRGLTLAVVLFAGLGLITLTDAKAGDPDLAKEILGTWEMVGRPDGYGSYGAPPADGARYKTFTNGTFVVSEGYPDFYAGATLDHHGGPYTLEGDQLTESVKFTDGLEVVSKESFKFKIKIEGDTYTQIGIGNDFNEVWKRVKSGAPKPKKATSDALQGTWQNTSGISLVISGSTLEFREADTNKWIKGSFSLYDTKPKQIAAVVTGCSDPHAVGTPIFGIYELKDGALTVSGFDPGYPFVPDSVDASGARKIIFKK